MGIFRQFPYSNFHDMNMDWLLNVFKDLEQEFNAFVENIDGIVAEKAAEIIEKGYFPFVTPQMFGAAGNGITDDTEAFRTCLGKDLPILIPKGDYIITEPLDVKSDTLFIGLNDAVLFDKREALYSAYTGLFNGDDIENVVFYNIKINTPVGTFTDPVTRETYYFKDCSNVILNNIHISDAKGGYAILFNHCNHTKVENCVINNYGYAGIANINNGSNFYAINNTILNALNDRFSGNNYAIILNGYDDVLTAIDYGGSNLNAIGNYCKNDTPTWELIDAHGGSNITVANNILENARDGIACFNEPEGRLFEIENMRIYDNVITCAHSQSIGITAGGHNVKVYNNKIDGAYTGIRGRYLYDSSIFKNDIHNTRDTGIYVNVLENVEVLENLLIGNIDAFGIFVGNTIAINVLVHDNILRNFTYGMRTPTAADVSNYVRFYNNKFYHVTNYERVSAEPGTVPQFYTTVPTWTTNAQKFDTIYNSDYDGTNNVGWIFDGSDWNEF